MENIRRKYGLSAAVLKNIALITMLIDHATAILLKAYLYDIGVHNVYSSTWYWIGRIIGRIAFVLYAFLIAEGAVYTKNRLKYALRLLALGIISIIPRNFADGTELFKFSCKNIFFLLTLGVLTIIAWDFLKEKIKSGAASVILRILLLAASCTVAKVCQIEYGLMGILLIMAFYIFRGKMWQMLVSVTLVMTLGYMLNSLVGYNIPAWFSNNQGHIIASLWSLDRVQVHGLLALPFICLYNGEKGRQFSKWFYYLFYPVHLAILGFICEILFR